MKKTIKGTVFFLSQTVVFALAPSTLAAEFTVEEATVSSIRSALASGETSCTQLTQQYLNRISAYDQSGPALNAIITTNPNALDVAADLDAQFAQSGLESPLSCVPVILKDNYDTADLPTTAGALALEGFIPPEDAFQVEQLREAGALILAKANLSEFAFAFSTESSLGGLTLNPYDLERNVGGSSGGTAAAIAANYGVIGLGTDTGGSIRIPSTFNSLVGLRPTIGLTSRSGIIPLALTQDVGGPITRTVADAAFTLDAITPTGMASLTAGFDPDDPITASSIGNIPESYTNFLDPDGLEDARIGVVRELFGPNDDPRAAATNEVINAAIEELESLGAEVIDTAIPNLDEILSFPSLSSFEFKRDLNNYLAARPAPPSGVRTLDDIIASGLYLEDFEEAYIDRNERGAPLDDPEYVRIITERPELTQTSILDALDSNNLDALLYPTSQSPPNLLGEDTGAGAANRLSPFSGFPAISVPAGFTDNGLPVNLELLGRAFSEPTLIELAYAYEQETQNRRPPASTPPLSSESIPEPNTTAALVLLGFSAIGVKLKQRHQ